MPCCVCVCVCLGWFFVAVASSSSRGNVRCHNYNEVQQQQQQRVDFALFCALATCLFVAPQSGAHTHTYIHTLCRSVSVSLTGTCHARIVIKCCTLIGVYARFGSRSRSRTCPLSAVPLLAPHPTPSSACYVREQFAEVCVCVCVCVWRRHCQQHAVCGAFFCWH